MSGSEGAEAALERADRAFAERDVEGLITHLSAAVRGFTAAEEPRRAAMACVRLGDTMANTLGNQTAARAWFARAERLVADLPPCLEQGWVAVAAMGCDVHDPATLLEHAELALDRARRFGDLNLETKALADAGLAHVQAGRVDAGMALLDEAMALVCGPADDQPTTAKSVCSFFTACYFAADFERAGSWADLLRHQGHIALERGGPVFLSSHCDSVQATLLMELGRWGEAEALLLRARTDFLTLMGFPSWHPDIALADLRTRQGRYAEAEALLLGKDQIMPALLPAAHLHLARGDHELALATAARGLRVMGADCLRAVELLTVTLDAHLARGDLDAALATCEDLTGRTRDLDSTALRARAEAARARLLAARGDVPAAIATLGGTIERLDGRELPWRRARLLLELARLHERAGADAAARLAATEGATALASLDVVVSPVDAETISQLTDSRGAAPASLGTATLERDGAWWVASHDGTAVRVRDSKGLRYLAELVAAPGTERHALDLVDRIEGVGDEGQPDRRALGDAGEVLDARARAAYRRRIEALRGDIDDALDRGALEAAEALQGELDLLVAQLAHAFGLGGRSRVAASAAERARLNVTRALRAALSRLTEALPAAGPALDRAVRTGTYCAYQPAEGDLQWVIRA